MSSSKDENKIFFLVRFPDQPLILEKDKALIIGRSDINDLVIPEKRASRRHTKIEWLNEKKSFVIKDLQSLNGTYVNGEKLSADTSQVLKSWDKIRIASTVYTFREEDDFSILDNEFQKAQQNDLEEATQFMSNSDFNSSESQSAFSGSLSSLCPVELFQLIQITCKTGMLKIATADSKGEFIVKEGQIIKAAFGNKVGKDAVYKFFHYNYGTFTFYPRKNITETPEIQESTNKLIMEGCQILDETGSV
jgi:pSer/pThr/pTyr-binding forkhead associated (FHA) protein